MKKREINDKLKFVVNNPKTKLTVQARACQTENIVEIQSSAAHVLFCIDYKGEIYWSKDGNSTKVKTNEDFVEAVTALYLHIKKE